MMIADTLSQELNIKTSQAESVIRLIDEGNTIPFIARYRKEVTGSLDDEILRKFDARLKYLRNLEEKKESVLNAIEEQGKLTAELKKSIDEAIRVTKPDGVILVAFLSVYAIMFDNYLQGNLIAGIEENFTEDYRIRHFEEQLFTGYDIVEFENLFADKQVQYLSTVAVDSILELAEGRSDFAMSDAEFEAFAKMQLALCEKRELLGSSSHLLYICKKK
jgi:hypothetical protein